MSFCFSEVRIANTYWWIWIFIDFFECFPVVYLFTWAFAPRLEHSRRDARVAARNHTCYYYVGFKIYKKIQISGIHIFPLGLQWEQWGPMGAIGADGSNGCLGQWTSDTNHEQCGTCYYVFLLFGGSSSWTSTWLIGFVSSYGTNILCHRSMNPSTTVCTFRASTNSAV